MSNASAISECHQTAISSCRISHSLILIVTLTLNAQTQVNDAKSRRVDLKRGQMLELSLVTPLDSGHARVGDDVVMRLPRPLMANGVTVLPVDSFVRARITNVTHAGKNCRSGRIDFEISPVKMSDGTEVKKRLVKRTVYNQLVLSSVHLFLLLLRLCIRLQGESSDRNREGDLSLSLVGSSASPGDGWWGGGVAGLALIS